MPELPDLQAFSQNLTKRLAGKKLNKLTILNNSKLKAPEEDFKKSFEKKELKEVYREGKELRFEFDDNSILGLHLMLSGELHLDEKTREIKNGIIELLFEDDVSLTMTDYQGMAAPAINPEAKKSPDALSEELDFSYLKNKLSKTRTIIKKFLLDQNMIRGIGNAYADEILWDALIDPDSICNKIPDEKIKVLAKSIKTILKNAIKQILKTRPDIISGEVRDFLDIHNAKKKNSPTGAVINQKMISGRKTYYTNEQELFK